MTMSLHVLTSLILLSSVLAFLDTTFTFHAVDSGDVVGKNKIVPIYPPGMDDQDYCASKEGETIGSVEINTRGSFGGGSLFCVMTYESADCSGIALKAHDFNRDLDGTVGDSNSYPISESPKSAQVQNYDCRGSSDQKPPADQVWQKA